MRLHITILCAAVSLAPTGLALAQNPIAPPADRWVTVTEGAAGTDAAAKDKATQAALRKAVEQACGVFINARSKTDDYKLIYDKVFADAVGYVKQFKVLKSYTVEGITFVTVKAQVSTKKFENDWAAIAHTVEQEGNPRLIIAITETGQNQPLFPPESALAKGIVLGKFEDFFLEKGIKLMDRGTAEGIRRRDLLLADHKDDFDAIAAAGVRLNADVVLVGRATVQYDRPVQLAGVTMHKWMASLKLRAVRTDSAQLLISKTYGPEAFTYTARGPGRDKALADLAVKYRKEALAALVEAWRKQVQVRRDVQMIVSKMDYTAWKKLREELTGQRGVQALRLREISAEVATIDVEYAYKPSTLADTLSELQTIKLKITDLTANRIKLEVLSIPAPPAKPEPKTQPDPEPDPKPDTSSDGDAGTSTMGGQDADDPAPAETQPASAPAEDHGDAFETNF